jgi:cell division transport system permease protein
MVRPSYFLSRALDALRRSPTVALVATLTVFVAVFVTGLFAGALGGAERLLERWAGDLHVSVYLAPDADLSAARDAAARIAPGLRLEAVRPEVALERLRASLGPGAAALEGVAPRVLPASVEVHAPGLPLPAVRELASRLEAVPGAEQVDFGGAWVERLEALLRRARVAGLVLLGTLAAATAVLASNTLRLAVYARRDEIEIMKLVGATDAFVAVPFLLEGLIEGLVGAGLAVLGLLAIQAALLPMLGEALSARLVRSDVLPTPVLLALLGGGAGLGLVASALSLRRFDRGP